MIRLGKTFGNLMVDVAAANEKLRARVHRAVRTATGASSEDVDEALEASGGEATVAIVSLLAEVDADTAPSTAPRRKRQRAIGALLMKLGVEAAVVDGILVGDVELDGGRIARVGLASRNGRGVAAPGFVDLQVNGFGGIDFLDSDAAGYRRAGEAFSRPASPRTSPPSSPRLKNSFWPRSTKSP